MPLSITVAPDDSPDFIGLFRAGSRPSVTLPTLKDIARIMMLEYPGTRVDFDPALGGVPVANVRIVVAEEASITEAIQLTPSP